MIYLISPYNDTNPYIRYNRFRLAARVCGHMAECGLNIYSPIVHWHSVVDTFPELNLGTDYKFWQRSNMEMMLLSTKAIVMTIEGWRDSLGVRDDIANAIAFSKPVFYLTYAQCLHYGEKEKA